MRLGDQWSFNSNRVLIAQLVPNYYRSNDDCDDAPSHLFLSSVITPLTFYNLFYNLLLITNVSQLRILIVDVQKTGYLMLHLIVINCKTNNRLPRSR